MIIKKSSLLILLGIILLGTLLRLMYFQHLTFGYDQARDAFQSISILKDLHPKIIGPTTDIRGLFHSPLYWYIISPFYFFSGGDPAIARIPMIFINILNIVFIYFLTKKLFNNEKISLLCSLFMSVSFEAVQYARWLSNPPPAILTTAIFFYGLWLVLKNKPIGLPLMILTWGFSVDFQFFLLYQIIFILFAFIYLFFTNKETIISSFRRYYLLYILSFLPWIFYIASEIKFKFQGLTALLGFFTKKEDSGFYIPQKLFTFINSLIKNIYVNLLGTRAEFSQIQTIVAFLILLIVIIYPLYKIFVIKKDRAPLLLLLAWFLSPIFIYPIENNHSYFLNIGNIYPLIILVVYVICDVGNNLRNKTGEILVAFVMILLVCVNLNFILRDNKNGETLFSVQNRQDLFDEKKVMDYIYEDNKTRDYAINTVTNPLLMNTTWAYLFDWYGKSKYGYMPHWVGYPLDSFGKEIQFSDEKWNQNSKNFYLIIEPKPGIPDDYIDAYIKYENTRSIIVETKKIGTFTVEKRRFNNDNHFLRTELDEML